MRGRTPSWQANVVKNGKIVGKEGGDHEGLHQFCGAKRGKGKGNAGNEDEV